MTNRRRRFTHLVTPRRTRRLTPRASRLTSQALAPRERLGLRPRSTAFAARRSPSSPPCSSLLCIGGALLAPWIAPHNPFDLASLDLLDAFTPPAWQAGGKAAYLLGTDNQGRDVLSAILYGARISLAVGVAAVLFAMVLGVTLGLISGYVGGRLDALIMRIADVQLSFPAILIALLIDGIVRVALPNATFGNIALFVLIFAIGISGWVQYARTVRGSTLVEKNKEYVQAARVIGRHPAAIMLRHLLPNVMGPVLVIATLHIATAIITEATLSFLGVGMPPTTPSLGTLIRVGNDFLFSGEWWIALFPGVALVVLVLSVNMLGDWLRDALNPEAAMSALLEVSHLRVDVPDAARHAHRGRRRLLRHRAGRSARRRGRIRRRQIAHRRGDHRPAGAARAHRRGRDPARGQPHRQSAAEAMRRIRGRRIGAIFQDPLTSLNPLYTIGRQITETILTHLPLSRARGARARDRAARRGRHPGAAKRASTTIRTSSPAACASAW